MTRRERSKKNKRPWNLVIAADDAVVAELYQRVLKSKDYKITVATSADSTLSMAKRDRPHLILLDLTEAGAGGNLRVLQAIRNHEDDDVFAIRVILIGSQASNRLFAWESGIDSFMLRPFHAKDLMAEIENVMARSDDERPHHRRVERDKAMRAS